MIFVSILLIISFGTICTVHIYFWSGFGSRYIGKRTAGIVRMADGRKTLPPKLPAFVRRGRPRPFAESFALSSALVCFAVGAGSGAKCGGLSRRCEACFLPSESAHRQVGMRRRQPKAGAMLEIWVFVRKAAGSFSICAVCRRPGRCGRPPPPPPPAGRPARRRRGAGPPPPAPRAPPPPAGGGGARGGGGGGRPSAALLCTRASARCVSGRDAAFSGRA